uniref:CCHC-type domain-containing protein n=1 Tax=Tanacetum cinerariifolium TaxID=118510 RepID=A0A699GQS2_TANCI|nr:hypothetical protein [Tanacetum cinerariifolium]
MDCSRIDKTSNGPDVKAKDAIIASTCSLVDRSLTLAEFSSLSDIVPSTVDTKYSVELADEKIVCIPLADETLMIRSNRGDGYASIVSRFTIVRFDIALGKANVVADALSRKERAKPLRIRYIIILSSYTDGPTWKQVSPPVSTVLDVFKDEGRLSEATWFTGTKRSVLKEIPPPIFRQPEIQCHALRFEEKALLTGKGRDTPAHGLISLIVCAFFLDQAVKKKPSENVQKGSELGSELTSLAGSELGSELTFFAGSELGLASYKSSEDYFSVTCDQKLCPFNFLLASCQVSSSELSLASYMLIEDYFPATCEQELCPLNFLLASCQVSFSELSPASYRMANLSEDIQCAGFDTRPLMLDRTDFASWQQRIQPYCWGKKNGVNILKSIDEGPFQMGTLRETLTEGTDGSLHLGPERPRVYSDLTSEEKDRGLRDSNYDQLYAYLKQYEVHANENKMMLDRFTQHTVDPLDLMSNVSTQQHYPQSFTTSPSIYVQPHLADTTQLDSGLSLTDNLIENITNTLALLIQSYKTYLLQTNNQLRTSSNPRNQAIIQDHKNRVGYANPGQARQIKCYNCNGIGRIARNCTQPKRPQNSEYFKDKMLLMQAQENGVTLDEEQLLFIAGGQDNVVDDDTMFMANLSSADPVYDEVGLSYDSDVLSEVHYHDHYQDVVCEHHEVHEMHDDLQPNYVVDSHTGYTIDSNMIMYDQYVKDNAVQVIQSDVYVVPNDAYMMILNDMHEPPAQYVHVTTQTKAVDKSLTAELETYKEQVELYERRARFELTEREQNIDEQLRIVINDRNIKEEKLKKELHSVKMQLASTINHNKSTVEEVTSLKNDFKQKENQYLEEFLDMKSLKEKVEDKLFKQD